MTRPTGRSEPTTACGWRSICSGHREGGSADPNGYYNLERMLKGVLRREGKVLLCGTCMDARGLREEELVEGCRRSSLDELSKLTLAADKVLVF